MADELRISVDEQQLARCLEPLARHEAPVWRLVERLLGLAQLIAILGGGLWAWYHFNTFEKRNEELNQRRTELEIQEKNILLQYENEQKRVDLIKAELETTEKRGVIREMTQRRLLIEHSLRVTPIDGLDPAPKVARYTATLSLDFTNLAQESVEITAVAIEKYLGNLGPGVRPVMFINGPAENGVVQWRTMNDDAGWKIATMTAATLPVGGRQLPLQTGGITGHLNGLEKNHVSYDYVISDADAALVGFIVDVMINGGQTTDDQVRAREWAYLPSEAHAAVPGRAGH